MLTGPALGSLIRTLLSAALVLGVALLMGFRSAGDPATWLATLGLVALFTPAITWMRVLFGMVGKTPAGANSLSLIFLLLPFTSSAFVNTASMPAGVRWFAEYQPLMPLMPLMPLIETLRGLLLGTPIGNNAVLAIAWCIVLTLVGYLWARPIYNRDPVR